MQTLDMLLVLVLGASIVFGAFLTYLFVVDRGPTQAIGAGVFGAGDQVQWSDTSGFWYQGTVVTESRDETGRVLYIVRPKFGTLVVKGYSELTVDRTP